MAEKITHNPLHAALIGIVQTLLNSLLLSGVHVRTQVPITLTDSEPEPDISVARGKLTDYLARHPGPSDVELVVEIAYSSLVTDRYKGEIYAEAKIPIYWIVNLVKRRVEVYSNPTISAAGPCYADCREFQPGEMIPVFVDGREVGRLSAGDLLPQVDAQ